MERGKYVVFDGMDGSGKGTQLALLQELLGDRVIFTREPGGTLFAEKIRDLARNDSLAEHSSALANMLLFFAAREELQHNLIGPALREGKTVFSDRGDSSTWAFQMWGEENRTLMGVFTKLRSEVFMGPHRKPPDLYVFFDLPAEMARKRAMADSSRGEKNHFDKRSLAYYERVSEGFHEFRKHFPAILVDADRPPQEVHKSVLYALGRVGIKL